MDIRYYKVAIKLKEKVLSNNIDLSKLEQDILQAKEEFNAKNENQIAVFKTHPRRINLFVRLTDEFQLDSIRRFLSTLIIEMNWNQYSIEDEDSFKIVFVKEIYKEDYTFYANESSSSGGDCIDKGVITKWAKTDNWEVYKEKEEENDHSEDDNRWHRNNKSKESIEKIKVKIDELISQEELKKELLSWIGFNQKVLTTDKGNKNQIIIPYDYIFIASPGSGVTNALKLMGQVYYYLNIIPRPEFNESTMGIEEKRHFFFGGGSKGGINGIKITDYESLEKANDKKQNKEDIVTVYIVDPKKPDYKKIINELEINNIYKKIILKDYSKDELLEILELKLKEYRFILSEKAKKQFKKYILKEKTVNVKDVASLSSKIVMSNIGNSSNSVNGGNLIIESIDFSKFNKNKNRINEIISEEMKGKDELNKLIALDDIKTQVNDIINLILINKRKQEEGLIDKDEIGSMHMNFIGNPGTGKTTVARIIGKILNEIGVLKKGEFIEVGREDLIAEYVGQTAIKTSEVLNKALDSVLFIDEAYSLNGGSQNDYGREALDTIIRHMENNRNRSVIIFAGYKEQMDDLFVINRGLKSRIPFTVEFQDYDKSEMLEIFKLITAGKYKFDNSVELELLRFFEKAKYHHKENFSNGRFVRNVYEKILMKQGSRLCAENKMDKESLREIKIEDLLSIYEEDEYKIISESKGNGEKVFGFAM